jgi:hypothetical protein
MEEILITGVFTLLGSIIPGIIALKLHSKLNDQTKELEVVKSKNSLLVQFVGTLNQEEYKGTTEIYHHMVELLASFSTGAAIVSKNKDLAQHIKITNSMMITFIKKRGELELVLDNKIIQVLGKFTETAQSVINGLIAIEYKISYKDYIVELGKISSEFVEVKNLMHDRIEEIKKSYI